MENFFEFFSYSWNCPWICQWPECVYGIIVWKTLSVINWTAAQCKAYLQSCFLLSSKLYDLFYIFLIFCFEFSFVCFYYADKISLHQFNCSTVFCLFLLNCYFFVVKDHHWPVCFKNCYYKFCFEFLCVNYANLCLQLV